MDDTNVRRFHVLVREGVDFEQIARMVEEGEVEVDSTDRVIFYLLSFYFVVYNIYWTFKIARIII